MKKELIDINEALRKIEHSKDDNPFEFTAYKNIWNMAHDSALSCINACSIVKNVVSKEEYNKLLEYKFRYENLCK